MKIKEVKISQTLQVKQYEPLTLELTCELAEGDSVSGVIDMLKTMVWAKLTGEGEEKLEIKTNKASTSPRPFKPKTKEEKALEEIEAPKKEVKAPTKPKANKRETVKNPHVPYVRELQVHKAEMSKILDTIDPNWKGVGASAAKATSIAMNGHDMFTNAEDKTVLSSFIVKAKEIYNLEYKKLSATA